MILPEIVAVGIYDSKIIAKNTAISKNRKTSMFEIELPVEDGGISYIDSGARQIKTNMMICAKPGQLRHTRFPFKCYYVHMIIHKGALYDALMNMPDFLETDKGETYKKLFKKLIRHYNTLANDQEIILQSLLLELIYKIHRDAALKNKNGSQTNPASTVEKALNYINEHLTEDLSLEKVAGAMSVSPIYFHNTFRKAVSKTLRAYVEEQRIKKAIHLLLTTNLSLTQIAFECGFASQSYFSYVFKRKMKVTPREYVKEIYNKYEI